MAESPATERLRALVEQWHQEADALDAKTQSLLPNRAGDAVSREHQAARNAYRRCATNLERALAPRSLEETPPDHQRLPRLTDLQRICNLNASQAIAVQQYIQRFLALELALEETPEPRAFYTILIEREDDGRMFASWTTGDGIEGGCAAYSTTLVGALAELCSTLLKIDEDKSVDRRFAALPTPEAK